MKKIILITITIIINQIAIGKTCKEFNSFERLFSICINTGIRLKVEIKSGDSLYSLAQKLTSNWKTSYQDIKRMNQNQKLYPKNFVQIPFSLLKPEFQNLSLKYLFPNDHIIKNAWKHYVTSSHETWSFISGVFTKRHINYIKLQSFNKTKKIYLRKGDIVWIPLSWIRQELLSTQQIYLKKPLQFFEDNHQKKFAIYKILQGESIYSAVIIRFTDRILDKEVHDLASQLLLINNIKDETNIPIGTKLKIPLDWISDEYLKNPINAQSDFVTPQKAKPPSSSYPLHIILDSGHGGNDPGAVAGSKKNNDLIFEDELTYDVLLRLRKFLEQNQFKVYQTIKDINQKYPIHQLKTSKDRDEFLLVHPNYNLNSSNIGINFRIYLVNYLYHKLIKKGVPRDNIIFISLHADALHSSIRGATIYYPDPTLKVSEFRTLKSIYNKRKEFISRIKFQKVDNYYQAKRSRFFADKIIKKFKSFNIKIHGKSPVRSYHYRNGRKTLPGILRYNKVPISILIEIANLKNRQDRYNMLQPVQREKIAKYIADTIKEYASNTSYQVASY